MADTLGAPRPAPPSRPASPAPLGDDDAAALRSLGIDLDAIRAAVDAQFGEGALEGAGSSAPGDRGDGAAVQDDADADEVEAEDVEPARRRRGWGGHLRFGRGAKKVLELSLREAIRLGSREIRTEHIALGLLRTDDEGVGMVLATLGVDVRALRADLEGRGRRTA